MSKYKAHGLVLIAAVLWGLTFPLNKIALNYLQPEHLGFLRYFFAAIIMLSYVKFSKRNMKVTKKQLGLILYTGALAFFGYAYFEVKSMSYLSSGVVSLFLGLIPVISITIEILLKRRQLKIRTVAVIVLAAVGVYLVIREEISLGGSIIGYIFILMAVSAWIIYLFKAVEIDADPFVIVAYQFAFAAVIHGGVFLTKINEPILVTPTLVAIIVYLVIFSTVIGYLFYYLAARILGAGIVTIYENLIFIVGFVSSALYFKSSITPVIWISFALILASISLSLTLDVQKH